MTFFPGSDRLDIPKHPEGSAVGKCVVCNKTLRAGPSGYAAHHECSKKVLGALQAAQEREENERINYKPTFHERLEEGFSVLNEHEQDDDEDTIH